MSDDNFDEELSLLLAKAGLNVLQDKENKQLSEFLALLIRWNQRINLTAVRDRESILSRHFVESIACAEWLPAGVSTLLDLGSGAGFPGIPIAICRPELDVTLAESQGKKAAFLQEAVRVLGLSSKVHAGRAEALVCTFDVVTLRAVDRMEYAVAVAASLVKPGGWLLPLTTESEQPKVEIAAGSAFKWEPSRILPGSRGRMAAFARRAI